MTGMTPAWLTLRGMLVDGPRTARRPTNAIGVLDRNPALGPVHETTTNATTGPGPGPVTAVDEARLGPEI